MSIEIEYDRDINPDKGFNTATGADITDGSQNISTLTFQSATDDDGFFIDVGWDAGPDGTLEDSLVHALETMEEYYASLNRLYVRFEGRSGLQNETYEFGPQEIQDLLDSDDKIKETRNLTNCAMTPIEVTAAPYGGMDDIRFRYKSNNSDGYNMQRRERFGREQAEAIAGSQGYNPNSDTEIIDAMTEALKSKT